MRLFKRFLLLFVALVLTFSLAACKFGRSGGNEQVTPTLSFDKVEVNLLVGDTYTLSPSITEITGSDLVTYSVSDDCIKVEGNVVTALKEGNAVVTAKLKDYDVTATIRFFVTAKAKVHIAAKVDSSLQGEYTGDGITLTVSESKVVVNVNGQSLTYNLYQDSEGIYFIEEVSGAEVLVYCTFVNDTVTNSKGTFTKKQPLNPSISFSEQEVNLEVGDTYTFNPAIVDASGSKTVIYTANNNCVSITNNVATALQAGRVTVTATLRDDNVSTTITLVITEKPKVHIAAKVDSSLQGEYTGDGITLTVSESKVVVNVNGQSLTYNLYQDSEGIYFIEEVSGAEVLVYCTFVNDTVTNSKGTFTKKVEIVHVAAHLDVSLQGDYENDEADLVVHESTVEIFIGNNTLFYYLYQDDKGFYFVDEVNGVETLVYCTFANDTVVNLKGTFTRKVTQVPTLFLGNDVILQINDTYTLQPQIQHLFGDDLVDYVLEGDCISLEGNVITALKAGDAVITGTLKGYNIKDVVNIRVEEEIVYSLIGAFPASQWARDVDFVQTEVKGKYTAQVQCLSGNEYRIRGNHSWDSGINIGLDASGIGINATDANNLVFSQAGICVVTLVVNHDDTYTISVSYQENVAASIDEEYQGNYAADGATIEICENKLVVHVGNNSSEPVDLYEDNQGVYYYGTDENNNLVKVYVKFGEDSITIGSDTLTRQSQESAYQEATLREDEIGEYYGVDVKVIVTETKIKFIEGEKEEEYVIYLSGNQDNDYLIIREDGVSIFWFAENTITILDLFGYEYNPVSYTRKSEPLETLTLATLPEAYIGKYRYHNTIYVINAESELLIEDYNGTSYQHIYEADGLFFYLEKDDFKRMGYSLSLDDDGNLVLSFITGSYEYRTISRVIDYSGLERAHLDEALQGSYVYSDDDLGSFALVFSEDKVVFIVDEQSSSMELYVDGNKYVAVLHDEYEDMAFEFTFANGKVMFSAQGESLEISKGDVSDVFENIAAIAPEELQGYYFGANALIYVKTSWVDIDTNNPNINYEYTIFEDTQGYYIILDTDDGEEKLYCLVNGDIITNKFGSFTKLYRDEKHLAHIPENLQGDYYKFTMVLSIHESEIIISDLDFETMEYDVYQNGNVYYLFRYNYPYVLMFKDSTLEVDNEVYSKVKSTFESTTQWPAELISNLYDGVAIPAFAGENVKFSGAFSAEQIYINCEDASEVEFENYVQALTKVGFKEQWGDLYFWMGDTDGIMVIINQEQSFILFMLYEYDTEYTEWPAEEIFEEFGVALLEFPAFGYALSSDELMVMGVSEEDVAEFFANLVEAGFEKIEALKDDEKDIYVIDVTDRKYQLVISEYNYDEVYHISRIYIYKQKLHTKTQIEENLQGEYVSNYEGVIVEESRILVVRNGDTEIYDVYSDEDGYYALDSNEIYGYEYRLIFSEDGLSFKWDRYVRGSISDVVDEISAYIDQQNRGLYVGDDEVVYVYKDYLEVDDGLTIYLYMDEEGIYFKQYKLDDEFIKIYLEFTDEALIVAGDEDYAYVKVSKENSEIAQIEEAKQGKWYCRSNVLTISANKVIYQSLYNNDRYEFDIYEFGDILFVERDNQVMVITFNDDLLVFDYDEYIRNGKVVESANAWPTEFISELFGNYIPQMVLEDEETISGFYQDDSCIYLIANNFDNLNAYELLLTDNGFDDVDYYYYLPTPEYGIRVVIDGNVIRLEKEIYGGEYSEWLETINPLIPCLEAYSYSFYGNLKYIDVVAYGVTSSVYNNYIQTLLDMGYEKLDPEYVYQDSEDYHLSLGDAGDIYISCVAPRHYSNYAHLSISINKNNVIASLPLELQGEYINGDYGIILTENEFYSVTQYYTYVNNIYVDDNGYYLSEGDEEYRFEFNEDGDQLILIEDDDEMVFVKGDIHDIIEDVNARIKDELVGYYYNTDTIIYVDYSVMTTVLDEENESVSLYFDADGIYFKLYLDEEESQKVYVSFANDQLIIGEESFDRLVLEDASVASIPEVSQGEWYYDMYALILQENTVTFVYSNYNESRKEFAVYEIEGKYVLVEISTDYEVDDQVYFMLIKDDALYYFDGPYSTCIYTRNRTYLPPQYGWPTEFVNGTIGIDLPVFNTNDEAMFEGHIYNDNHEVQIEFYGVDEVEFADYYQTLLDFGFVTIEDGEGLHLATPGFIISIYNYNGYALMFYICEYEGNCDKWPEGINELIPVVEAPSYYYEEDNNYIAAYGVMPDVYEAYIDALNNNGYELDENGYYYLERGSYQIELYLNYEDLCLGIWFYIEEVYESYFPDWPDYFQIAWVDSNDYFMRVTRMENEVFMEEYDENGDFVKASLFIPIGDFDGENYLYEMYMLNPNEADDWFFANYVSSFSVQMKQFSEGVEGWLITEPLTISLFDVLHSYGYEVAYSQYVTMLDRECEKYHSEGNNGTWDIYFDLETGFVLYNIYYFNDDSEPEKRIEVLYYLEDYEEFDLSIIYGFELFDSWDDSFDLGVEDLPILEVKGADYQYSSTLSMISIQNLTPEQCLSYYQELCDLYTQINSNTFQVETTNGQVNLIVYADSYEFNDHQYAFLRLVVIEA